MRNIIQYPVTIAEIVETLTRLSAEAMERNRQELACGDMDAYVLQKAAELMEKYPAALRIANNIQ